MAYIANTCLHRKHISTSQTHVYIANTWLYRKHRLTTAQNNGYITVKRQKRLRNSYCHYVHTQPIIGTGLDVKKANKTSHLLNPQKPKRVSSGEGGERRGGGIHDRQIYT